MSSGSTAAASSGRASASSRARGKHVHLCPADDEPEILEEAEDLVLKIPLDLNEQSSADKKGFGRVTVEIFDVDFLVPPTLHDARNAHSVVTITLVDLHLQNRAAKSEGLDDPGTDRAVGQRLAPKTANPSPLAGCALCSQTPKVGAVCPNWARTALCGGREVTRVPTAIQGQYATSTTIR